MATKLPKPPAKEAAAIEARAKAAGRKPKDMQAAVAATYARTQERQTALASKTSIPKGEAIQPVAAGSAIAQAAQAKAIPKPPAIKRAATPDHPGEAVTPGQATSDRKRAVMEANDQRHALANARHNSRRMPRAPGNAFGLRDRFGPPPDATDAEKAAWQTWWNSRPKRGSSTPVTPPTGGAS